MSQEEIQDDDVYEHFPEKLVLTDLFCQRWTLVESMCVGSVGEIYSASTECDCLMSVGSLQLQEIDVRYRPDNPHAEYVIKVERSVRLMERKIYLEIGYIEKIEQWKEKRGLKFLGMPELISYGFHKFNKKGYQFFVLERLGKNLQTFLTESGIFSDKTVLNLGIQILNVLEYIHDGGFVHRDIKASNLLVDPKCSDQVYLVDFGISRPYLQFGGTHFPDKPNVFWADEHEGTLEFTSRDAHAARFSRRGDLEILAYNMLKWSSGKLPWDTEAKEKNNEAVVNKKIKCLGDITNLFTECYGSATPCPGLEQLFNYMVNLDFDEAPLYDDCRQFLREGLGTAEFVTPRVHTDSAKVIRIIMEMSKYSECVNNSEEKTNVVANETNNSVPKTVVDGSISEIFSTVCEQIYTNQVELNKTSEIDVPLVVSATNEVVNEIISELFYTVCERIENNLNDKYTKQSSVNSVIPMDTEMNPTEPANIKIKQGFLVPYELSSDSDTEDSESDSASSTSESDSTSSAEELVSDSEDDTIVFKNGQSNKTAFKPIKTRGELGLEDLPPIEHLQISAEGCKLVIIGHVHSIVDTLVAIHSCRGAATLGEDSHLFAEDGSLLGQIFDIFGNTQDPYYAIRFNNTQEIEDKCIKIGDKVYYAPENTSLYTTIFAEEIRKLISSNRGSDASWEDNNEPPDHIIEYSDDECERLAKKRINQNEARMGVKRLCRRGKNGNNHILRGYLMLIPFYGIRFSGLFSHVRRLRMQHFHNFQVLFHFQCNQTRTEYHSSESQRHRLNFMRRLSCKQYKLVYKAKHSKMASHGNESHRFIKTNCKYPFVLKGKLRRSNMKPVPHIKKQANLDPLKCENSLFPPETNQILSSTDTELSSSQDSVYEKSILSHTMMTLRRYPPELVISLLLLVVLAGYILILNTYNTYGSPVVSRLLGNRTKLPDFTLPNFEDLMRHDFKLH
uniref:H/ACA ribonucleoprotein complex non-core subunit NAF1 n=1 Tax=Strigamia maritima TaxID=126957 RepID=T1JIQ5_STRMM